MKKILVFLSVLLFPFLVNASHLDEDITILENGDILVKEAISIDGSYNGFNLIIKYKYYDDNSIYSADSLEVVKICESDKYNSLTDIGSCFSLVEDAQKGDSLVYTQTNYDNRTSFMFYNPSTRQKAFYIEYILKNVVVSHNDIEELRLNMLSSSLSEDFDNINIKVNLGKSVNDLRAWAHGPLWGNVELSNDKDYVLFTIQDYENGTDVDIRLTFDKDLVKTDKTTNEDMLDKIIAEETKLADAANEERENARKELEKETIIREIFILFVWMYIISLVVLTIVMYNKYDKEYKSDFNNKYYRDFPSNDSPEVIEYLLKNNISTVGFTACILNIIYKKGFLVEPISTTSKILKNNKTDYILKLNDKDLKENLTTQEEKIRTFLVTKIGNDNQFKLSDLKKVGNSDENAKEFIRGYNDWLKESKKDAESRNFYENKKIPGLLIFYSLLPLILSIFALYVDCIIHFVAVAAGFAFFIYIFSFKRRTKYANELYAKWNALKNFMVDFGKFSDKDLPEITLWEKYLVYAHVFGIASKLRKTMELKIPNLNEVMSSGMTYADYWYLNNAINRSVSETVSAAVRNANSRIAASNDSSGIGSGGGFSAGGGFSGGGGSGGGRF